jgi:hypothetical protein
MSITYDNRMQRVLYWHSWYTWHIFNLLPNVILPCFYTILWIQLYSILNWAVNRDEWSASRSGLFTPSERLQVRILQEAVCFRGRSGGISRKRTILSALGFELSPSSPYTGYNIFEPCLTLLLSASGLYSPRCILLSLLYAEDDKKKGFRNVENCCS